MRSVGAEIWELKGVRYGDISKVTTVPWARYRTCRKRASRREIIRIFDLVMDERADYDERLEAVCDGLWDALMHQYTMYSITPIALHYLLTTTSLVARENSIEAQRFVSVCSEVGSEKIFLTNREIFLNKLGLLPIFRIEDVINVYT